MPVEKEKLTLRKGKLPSKIREELVDYVRRAYGEDVASQIPHKLRYVCFEPDFCLIYAPIGLSEEKLTLIYEGAWIATYTRGLVVPSIPFSSKVFSVKGPAVAIEVSEQGVKAFLYGNDILPISVIRVIPPRLGVYAVIDSTDGAVIGFVKWNNTKAVYENVYDAGVFLRKLG